MGKRFVKQLGQFIVTLFGITFLDILSHLFSTRRSSNDATRNGRHYRVSGAHR